MEKPQGFRNKYPQGGPKGNQTVQRGAAPKDSLITQGTFREKNYSDKPKAFPLFVRLWGKKPEGDAAEGLFQGKF